MNDICEKLYSKESEGIIARSVNMDDVEYWLTDAGKKARDSYTKEGYCTYGQTGVYKEDKSFPKLYQYEKGAALNKDGLGINDCTSKLTEEQRKSLIENSGVDRMAGGLNVTSTYYEVLMNDNYFGKAWSCLSSSKYYFIAARCVLFAKGSSGISWGHWGFFICRESIGQSLTFVGYITDANGTASLRPVVSLKSNTIIEVNENGSNSRTPHQITKY